MKGNFYCKGLGSKYFRIFGWQDLSSKKQPYYGNTKAGTKNTETTECR